MLQLIAALVSSACRGHLTRSFLSLMLSVSVLVLLLSCRTSTIESSPELEAVKQAVTRFILEAYAVEGDIDQAYSMLDDSTRQSCTKDEFAKLAVVGRRIVGQRELRILRISEVRISGENATLKVEAIMDRVEAYFIPENTTLVKESGNWRYKVTTDPTCKSLALFFELQEVPDSVVKPIYETNPNCERGYPLDCIPRFPPDLDCKDIEYRNFQVWPPDPHGFDPDGNHFGCEK